MLKKYESNTLRCIAKKGHHFSLWYLPPFNKGQESVSRNGDNIALKANIVYPQPKKSVKESGILAFVLLPYVHFSGPSSICAKLHDLKHVEVILPMNQIMHT